MKDNTYRIGELVSQADVTRRTVHYYINKGLVPPAEGSGVLSYYTDDHLNRIILIKKLQESHFPLEEIRKIVTPLNPDQVLNSIEKIRSDQSAGKKQLPEDIILKRTKAQEENHSLNSGDIFEKVKLGSNIEIHIPVKLREKNPELVKSLIENAKKTINNS